MVRNSDEKVFRANDCQLPLAPNNPWMTTSGKPSPNDCLNNFMAQNYATVEGRKGEMTAELPRLFNSMTRGASVSNLLAVRIVAFFLFPGFVSVSE